MVPAMVVGMQTVLAHSRTSESNPVSIGCKVSSIVKAWVLAHKTIGANAQEKTSHAMG